VRSLDRDGYEAVQLTLGKKRREFKNRPNQKVDVATLKLDDAISVDSFAEGDKVRVSGITKGKGFAGVVKRYDFRGGPKTHGQKNRHRHPGSIGSTAFQRVVPGRRMAGHMGVERVTIKNLVIAAIDKEKNLLFLRGAVPGNRGGLIEIATTK
jgi:large subunit ribosomal protein L3